MAKLDLRGGRCGQGNFDALRLEKAFGVRMDTLLRMQTVYDIAQARKRAPMIDVPRFATA